ncbi:response regulator [Woodsholea maritima]|uniref:response regulator n=1 Tax=Woodsholea maritima TaxID=240237 RepID=UPI00035CD4FD|nr:response regulator [Woodsholea maritima]
MKQMPLSPLVLLVEDDDQDALLFERVLRDQSPRARLVRATQGGEALEILKNNELDQPDCIVLDLKLKGEDGIWVLQGLLNDQSLDTIPVIVFSGNPERMRIASSAFNNVASLVRKPQSLEDYSAALLIVCSILQTAVKIRAI